MENDFLVKHTFYQYSDINIVFGIKTKTKSLKDLSDLIKIQPTRGFSFGEKYLAKRWNVDTKQTETIETNRPTTVFAYETKQMVITHTFQEHADHLIYKLNNVKSELNEILKQTENFEISIQVYLTIDKEQKHFGFAANSLTLKKLTEFCHWFEWTNA